MSTHDRKMTVAQLRTALAAFPDDMRVVVADGDRPEEVAEREAVRIARKARQRVKGLAYYQAYKEECKARARAHYAAHTEEEKARQQAYKAEHREEHRAYNRAYMKTYNKSEKVKTYRKTEKAKAVRREQKRLRRRTPEGREVERLKEHRRRARQLGNTPTERLLTTEQWRKIRQLSKGLCHWCGTKCKPLTMDHVIPLSKGGLHSAENIVVSCFQCNSAKRDKVITLL